MNYIYAEQEKIYPTFWISDAILCDRMGIIDELYIQAGRDQEERRLTGNL